MKFQVRTTLGEEYTDVWYSTGKYSKPNLYREDEQETGINGFLEQCLIRNLGTLEDSEVESASDFRPVVVPIAIQYVPGNESPVASSKANGQLELPLSDGHVVPFAGRTSKRKRA